MVVVVHSPLTVMSMKFVHKSLADITLTIVVPSGTKELVYPTKRAALLTPVSKADIYPSTSEYRLKGPVSAPAVVSVMVTIMVMWW